VDQAAAGSRAFAANCGACHTASQNGAARVGPNLFGVAGRRAASVPGFNYSPALRNSGITWTSEQLLAFVQHPTRMVPGTRMTYAGVRNPDQAAAIVTYLESLH
jgi:cytochrome c